MRLKSLKLSGFKSFANPTTFQFNQGITAIVGPNGCGKSNVIDAIRWVLGESSAKQLRGGAMRDVIFAGTQDKAAKSLASVELTFEHTQNEQTGIRHALNLYQELSVRRQVNAEGKSDYSINGTRCRRRDVVDVFLGTGLGPRSYSVIQQGMIGRIVDSNPMQLREFIEEAAGVSRYQARREETQKKLLKTRENLDRLHDIETELTRQKQTLSKQATSAHAYQQTLEALNQAKEQLAILQLQQAKALEIHYKTNHQTLASKVAALQISNNRTKTKLDKLSERIAEEQWLKDEARDQLHQHDMLHQTYQHTLTTLESDISQLQNRLQANLDRQAKTEDDIIKFESSAAASVNSVTDLTPKLANLQVKKEQLAAQYALAQVAREESRDIISRLESQQKDIEQQLALSEQAISQRHKEQAKLQRARQAWHVEAIKWQVAGIEDSGQHSSNQIALVSADELANMGAKLASLARQNDNIADKIETTKPQFDQLSQTLNDNLALLAQLEKQHASLIAEYDTLQAIVNPKTVNHRNQTNLPKSVSVAASTTSLTLATLPKVVDTIELTEEGRAHTEALDEWLAFWLDSRVLEDKYSTEKSAAHRSNWITAILKGLPETNVAESSNGSNASNSDVNKSDVEGNTEARDASDKANCVLVSTLSYQPDKDKVLSQAGLVSLGLLPLSGLIARPKLGMFEQCYLYIGQTNEPISGCPDNNKSTDISKNHNQTLTKAVDLLPSGSVILTKSGWMISQLGIMHLAKLNTKGQPERYLAIRLQQQYRLEILETMLGKVEEKIDSLTNQTKKDKTAQAYLKVDIEESTAQGNAIVHRLHALQQKRTELNATLARQLNEQQQLKQLKHQLDNERDEIEQDLQNLITQKQKTEDTLKSLLPKVATATSQQTYLEQEQYKISQQEREVNNTYAQVQNELNKSDLASTHQQAQLDKLALEFERLRHAQLDLTQAYDNAQQQLPKAQKKVKMADITRQQQQVTLDERQSVIKALHEESQHLQEMRDNTECEWQQLQAQLGECTTQVAIAKERIIEASERMQALGVEVNPAVIIADFIAHSRTLIETKAGDKLDKLQQSVQQLTHQLKAMGAVNIAAAAELALVNGRLIPLEQQIGDITASMDTLMDAISSIDIKTKALFLETLDAVNISLATLFTKVFGGGKASLTLVNEPSGSETSQKLLSIDKLSPNEHWRAGLELMAQPRGKKNSRLAVLSGGEKTLTALSLIFAIFKQHPAPFCVLDEVDAPLDDANVTRFTNLIADLAEEVQFIFISHNKLAMQTADELKGITMPQAGISSLVSVSLEEAAQYLESTG